MRYGLSYRWRLTVAMLVMLGAVASSMAIPRLLGTAIDSALSDGVRADLAILAGVIIGLGLIRGLTGYFQSYLSEGVSQRAAFDIRNEFFEKLQRLSFGFHDNSRLGTLCLRPRPTSTRSAGCSAWE